MIFRIWAACLLTMIVCSGCQSFPLSQKFSQTVGYRENNSARENPADQSDDPWISDMGEVTRSEHVAEPVNDPLKIRKVFVSEKARSIERNLGVGD